MNYSYGGEVRLPVGTGLVNQPLVINASTISLRAPSSGFMMRANYGPLLPSSVTRLLWTGAARTPGQGQINMLTVAATVAASRMVTGSNVSGIMFDCNFVAGCAGPVFLSVREAVIDVATREPNGIAYPASVLTAARPRSRYPHRSACALARASSRRACRKALMCSRSWMA